ncbi:uncharacterized protein TNCV_3679111 [Trichonephila clavipes]|nr:uncharacterized protein TNCV_3679111 [Trichonephila clavipes]
MPCRRHPASFDQFYEFNDPVSIVAYSDCGFSFRNINQSVKRNQATERTICHHLVQDETMNQWGRSHPCRCTTAHYGRQIVFMTVIDRAATLLTIAQHIQSVTHH